MIQSFTIDKAEIGVFDAQDGFEVCLGGAALRAFGLDRGCRGAWLSLFAALRKRGGLHGDLSRGGSVAELVRHDHATFGASQTFLGKYDSHRHVN